MNKIANLKEQLVSIKPRSQRRVVIERELVHLVLKQLRLENRKEKSRPIAQRTN